LKLIIPKIVDDLSIYANAVPEYFCRDLVAKFEHGRRFGEVIDGFVSGDGVDSYKSGQFLTSEDVHMVEHERWDRARFDLHKLYILPVLQDYLSRYKHVSLAESRLDSASCIVSRYAKGEGHFAPHQDSIGGLSPQRSLTVICYLNSVYEGGDTFFFNQEFAVQPRLGSVLVFPSNFVYGHEGRPPISNDKYITVSFANVEVGNEEERLKALNDV